MNANKLKAIFKSAKIKFKKVITKTRSRRNQTAESLARDANIFTELVKYYSRCLRFDQEVILIDEAVFSQKSCKPYAWAAAGSNVVASAWWKSQPCVAVCGAVSEQRGLICSMQRPKSFNQDSFIEFL